MPTESELRQLMANNLNSISLNFDKTTPTDYTKGPWPSYENKVEFNEITNFTSFLGNGYGSYISNEGNGHMVSAIKGSGSQATWYGFGYNTPLNTMDGRNPSYSIYMVSDGWTTLSSINDPSLNINNANAPVNNATSVPAPATALILATGLFGFSARRRKTT